MFSNKNILKLIKKKGGHFILLVFMGTSVPWLLCYFHFKKGYKKITLLRFVPHSETRTIVEICMLLQKENVLLLFLVKVKM